MICRSRILPCLLVAVLSGTCCLRAQTPAPADTKAAPAANASKIGELLAEAQSLQARKRFIDAFSKLDEAEKLDASRPEIYNIRGAIYLAMQVRDTDKAREQFTKAKELSKDAMPPLFNLAEVEFISENWAGAEKGFADVLVQFPKLPGSVRHLVIFKQLLTMAKQDKIAEAEKLLAESFTFMDDTPAYYFSKGLIALQKKQKQEGNDWITKAQIIFKQGDNSAYLDSLMESHYIDSLAVGKPESK